MIKILMVLFLATTLNADYLVLKLGTRGINRTESEMRKDWIDGQIVEILPDTDPISDNMKKHFQIVKVAKHYTQSEKNEVLRSSYTETIGKDGIVTQGEMITRRRYYVPITDIVGKAEVDTLKTMYSKTTINPIADLTAFKESDIIKDTFKLQITTNSFDKGGSISIGTCTIGTGQGYATVSAFEAGLATVLNGAVTGYINANYNDTTAVTFTGTTGNATAQIYLSCNDAYWCGGKYDGTKASMTVAGNAVINICEKYVNIDRLQISSAAYNYGFLIYNHSNSTITIRNCFIEGRNHASSSGNAAIFSSNGNSRTYVTNVVAWNFGSGSGSMCFWLNNSTDYMFFYNCTVYGGTGGVYRAYFSNFVPKFECYNCIANNVQSGFVAVTLATRCVSSVGTDKTNGNLVGNVMFTNAAIGDLSYVSTDTTAVNTGMIITSNESLTPYTYGIENNARGASWDIGAFEYVSAEPPVSGGKRRNPYARGFVLQ